MKNLKRSILVLMLFCMVLLCGCHRREMNLTVKTSLNMDNLFVGSRTMTVDIPARDYKKIFGSDKNKLTAAIRKDLPQGMKCSVSEDESKGAALVFEIPFTSKREYQTMIDRICDANKAEGAVNPAVNFDYSRSILKRGYTIDENFVSSDLLYWLEGCLKEAYESLRNTSVSMKSGQTEVLFDGMILDVNDTGVISISDLQSNAFDSMQVMVTMDRDQTFDVQISYVVSNEVVANLGKRLEKLMNGLLPEDGVLSFEDNAYNRTYTLLLRDRDADTVRTDMNKVLCTGDTVFEVVTEGDADNLSATMSIVQYFDGSYFLDFTDPDTKMSYVLIVDGGYTVNSCEGTYGYLIGDASVYSSGNCKLTMSMTNAEEVTTVFGFSVDIDTVDVNTNVHSIHNIDREVSIKLSAEADELIGARLSEKFENLTDEWKESEQVTVDQETMINHTTYTIRMHATSPEEMTSMTRALFGEDNDNLEGLTLSMLAGGEEKHQKPWIIDYKLEDTLNLSSFLRGSQVQNGLHYTLSYPKGYKAAFNENSIFEDSSCERNTIICSTYDKIMTVGSHASKINAEGILILIIWVLSLLITLIVLILNSGHLIYYIRHKKLDMDGKVLFNKRNTLMMTAGTLALVAFLFMTVRLLFKVY